MFPHNVMPRQNLPLQGWSGRFLNWDLRIRGCKQRKRGKEERMREERGANKGASHSEMVAVMCMELRLKRLA